MYAVVSGSVEIFHSNSRRCSAAAAPILSPPSPAIAICQSPRQETRVGVVTTSTSAVFGELGFFSNLPRSASARSLEFTTIVRIPRGKFISMLQEMRLEEDFELICMIRDELVLKANISKIGVTCWSCGG